MATKKRSMCANYYSFSSWDMIQISVTWKLSIFYHLTSTPRSKQYDATYFLFIVQFFFKFSLCCTFFQGYLFISVLVNTNSDLIRLIIQSIKNDLASRNPIHVNLALQCIANIGSKEMAETFGTEIPKLLAICLLLNFAVTYKY